GQPNTFDDNVAEGLVQDMAPNEDNIFQADQCDAFDSDVDEAPTTQKMFMANLSSATPVYDEASPSYDSNTLSEGLRFDYCVLYLHFVSLRFVTLRFVSSSLRFVTLRFVSRYCVLSDITAFWVLRKKLGVTVERDVMFEPERPRTYADLDYHEQERYKADFCATLFLLKGLPKDIYMLVNHIREAKVIWNDIKMLMGDTRLTKNVCTRPEVQDLDNDIAHVGKQHEHNECLFIPGGESSVPNDAYVMHENSAYVPDDSFTTTLNIYKDQELLENVIALCPTTVNTRDKYNASTHAKSNKHVTFVEPLETSPNNTSTQVKQLNKPKTNVLAILSTWVNSVTKANSSELMQNSVSPTPYVPPSKKDYEILFQQLFDEYFNPTPRVVSLVLAAVAALRVVDPVGSPSSTTIDQDVPSASTSPTTQEIQS
nr:integrase, catalytic region, zinc finger, CCHC-type, peptidase aspartic, catalytic [Tanacetum cinerariifolium]